MVRTEPSVARIEDTRVARLLGLLLVNALETVAGGRRAPGARETREWLCGTAVGPYSFEQACEAFGLPPRALRRRLGMRAHGGRRPSRQGWTRAGR